MNTQIGLKNLMIINYLVDVNVSSLKDECVRDKDYKHIVIDKNTFKRKQWVIVMIFILRLDVLLLTDVFENFISVCTE